MSLVQRDEDRQVVSFIRGGSSVVRTLVLHGLVSMIGVGVEVPPRTSASVRRTTASVTWSRVDRPASSDPRELSL